MRQGAATRKARREKPIVLGAGGGSKAESLCTSMRCPPLFAKPRLMPLAELAGTGPDDPERLGDRASRFVVPLVSPPFPLG